MKKKITKSEIKKLRGQLKPMQRAKKQVCQIKSEPVSGAASCGVPLTEII